MLTILLYTTHVLVCLFLILVVLLQQGRGGGMGAAFGGGAAQQVFGGRGAGNILTKATAICATTFMLTSVGLAYISSSGDRDLKARIAAEEKSKSQAVPRPKDSSGGAKPAESSAAPAASSGTPQSAPAPSGP